MAEAVVSIALETIRDLLLEEGRFLAGVGDQVKELERQLREMKCFLEDADKRRHESRTISNWISEIKDLVYRSESSIERHAAYQVSSRRRGLRQFVRKYSCILEDCSSLHQLGSEISQITTSLERISKDMQENGIKRSIIMNPNGEGGSSARNNMSRKTFPYYEMGDCFVGMEDELKLLVHHLGKETEDRIISVWGMGGSGKTAIAKKLYNEMTAFDLSAWVCITQQCESRPVWEDVLRQLENQNKKKKGVSFMNNEPRTREEVPSLSDFELIERLCEMQREKRCLIVLDDVWELFQWEELKHPFIVQDLQSKILVTTRKQNVAKIGLAVEHGLLHMDAALELLKNKAFQHGAIPDFALEERVEKIGKEMVQKCGYLPLAICLLGGVLRQKKSIDEWESVNEHIKAAIYGDEEQIDGVLNLSYESLPYYLKPCFLYMGIYDEDETIYAPGLYKRWIAQGMISYENIGDKEGSTLMDIAELYLGELASRSIVQVELQLDYDVAKYDTCKLHDVVRELCLKLGNKEDFGVKSLEYEGGKFSTLLREASSHTKIQHLAINFRSEVELERTVAYGEDTSKRIRSLQLYNDINLDVIEFPPQSIVDFQRFKLLRDLVIVGFKFAGGKLPRGIPNLVHLRCLRLQRCELDKLPSSIRNLVYMDTLDLTDSMNVKVPHVFKEMVRLKHLYFPFYEYEKVGNYRVRLDEGLDEMETLLYLDSRCHEFKWMERMKNLRCFAARIHDNENLSVIMNGIMNWNKIEYCFVTIEGSCDLTSERMLEKVLTCPNLYKMSIAIELGKALAECWSDLLSSKLKCLDLIECEIEDDPMGILGKLPCLIKLRLYPESFVGEEMQCPANSFPRLKILTLRGLRKLREWRVEAGAMPLLSKLTIGECSCLERIPEGLSGISTLQRLIIKQMPEFKERLLQSGQELLKVRHVPSIIIED